MANDQLIYHIGITGTRNGMNDRQKDSFRNILREIIHNIGKFEVPFLGPCLHHGDCIGADEDSHDIAREPEFGLGIVIHPPVKAELRAYCKSKNILPAKSYFARNRDIVDVSALMIGVPATEEETTGGTWYTINYAKKKNKPLYIVYPSGRIEKINM